MMLVIIRRLLQGVVVEELLDEVNVRHNHSPAAVAVELQGVESFPESEWMAQREGRVLGMRFGRDLIGGNPSRPCISTLSDVRG